MGEGVGINQAPAMLVPPALNRMIAPVTGLKFIEDDHGTAEPHDRYLLAAIGNEVQIFVDGANKPCTVESIFPREYRIHGFSDVANGRLIIYGGRIVALARINFANNETRVELLKRTEFLDWVWDVHWLSGGRLLAVACGHSTTYICDAENLDESFKLQSDERELTWSTTLFTDSGELFGVAGSSFGDVLSWRVVSATLMEELVKNSLSCFTDTRRVEKLLPVHRLKAHDGPIMRLTISQDRRYMATASVDRSVRVWKRGKSECMPCGGSCFTHMLTHYGHLARVWDVCFTQGMGVASVGEDHVCRVWSEKAGLEKVCFHGHSGRNIWRVAVSRGQIATGGEDGGVIVRPLQGGVTVGPFTLPRFENPRKKGLFKECGRSIVAIDETSFILSTDYGRILRGCFKNGSVEWVVLFSQGTAFTPCSLVVEGEMILAGRTDGSVIALRDGILIGTMQTEGMVMGVFADVTNGMYDVLIASPRGGLCHYHISSQDNINLLGSYEMRNPVKSSLVTAACVMRQQLLVMTGDRGGRVHTYALHKPRTTTRANNITHALKTVKLADDRISTLTPTSSRSAQTTSFDGSVTHLHISSEDVSVWHRNRPPKRTDTITCAKNGTLFGLHGAEGVLWDRQKRERLRTNIGNWRRAHDITECGVLYWRGGVCYTSCCDVDWGIIGGLGGRINGMCYTRGDVVVCGDGIGVFKGSVCTQMLSEHRSSVHGIGCGVVDGDVVMVSVGGLDEIFIWVVRNKFWRVKQGFICGDGKVVGRIVSVCVDESVFVGRCDGGVWKLEGNGDDKRFTEIWRCDGGVLTMDSKDGMLVVGDTKGWIYIFSSTTGIWGRVHVHEGGVNDAKIFREGFVCAGDDGWVRYLVRTNNKEWVIRWEFQNHGAGVGGLVVIGKRAFSVGGDQRIVEWNDTGVVKWRMHGVVDAACVAYDDETNELLIGGIGMCRIEM